jgi:hypothetical protein
VEEWSELQMWFCQCDKYRGSIHANVINSNFRSDGISNNGAIGSMTTRTHPLFVPEGHCYSRRSLKNGCFDCPELPNAITWANFEPNFRREFDHDPTTEYGHTAGIYFIGRKSTAAKKTDYLVSQYHGSTPLILLLCYCEHLTQQHKYCRSFTNPVSMHAHLLLRQQHLHRCAPTRGDGVAVPLRPAPCSTSRTLYYLCGLCYAHRGAICRLNGLGVPQRALHFQRSGAEPQRVRWKILLSFALLLAINNNIVPA